jgi:hypothetical protein
VCPLSPQALTCYGLGSYQQHRELLECPGLVEAIVQHMAPPEQQQGTDESSNVAHMQLTPTQLESAEAAVEAALSLIISKAGLQVNRPPPLS